MSVVSLTSLSKNSKHYSSKVYLKYVSSPGANAMFKTDAGVVKKHPMKDIDAHSDVIAVVAEEQLRGLTNVCDLQQVRESGDGKSV